MGYTTKTTEKKSGGKSSGCDRHKPSSCLYLRNRSIVDAVLRDARRLDTFSELSVLQDGYDLRESGNILQLMCKRGLIESAGVLEDVGIEQYR